MDRTPQFAMEQDPLFSLLDNEVAVIAKDRLVAEAELRDIPTNSTKDVLVAMIAADNRYRQNRGTLELTYAKRVASYENLSASNNPPQSVPTLDINTLIEALSRLQTQPSQIHIVSSHDAVNTIPKFSGEISDSVINWIHNVDKAAASAKWSDELTLLNASTRLVGQALNWHKVDGIILNTWTEYRNAIETRFNVKMSPAQFIAYYTARKLLQTESVASYVSEKNAMLQKSPFTLQPSERVMMILQDIPESTCALTLATPMCATVSELLDRAYTIDQIRQIQPKEPQKQKLDPKSSDHKSNSQPKSQHKRPENTHFNPYKDNPDEMTCYRCHKKGHVSYNCTEPAPPGKQPLRTPLPGQTPQSTQPKPSTPKSKPVGAVNCVASTPSLLSFVPVKLAGEIIVDALPDTGSFATVIRRSLVPKSAIIQPWTSGSFAVAGGQITPSGWFSTRIQIGRIDHIMPKIAIYDPLPVAMLLGKDWQCEINAAIMHEPNGAVCIMTPTATEKFSCVFSNKSVIGCMMRPTPIYIQTPPHKAQLDKETQQLAAEPLISPVVPILAMTSTSVVDVTPRNPITHDQVIEPANPPETIAATPQPAIAQQSANPPAELHTEELTSEQENSLQTLVAEFGDIFVEPGAEIGLFPNFNMEINLKHDTPIKCKPYRVTQPDREFIRAQVQEWLDIGICRRSNSPYAAPCFVVDQPFHETTPRRLVIDYARTINPITIKDPFPIDNMEEMVQKMSGRRYKSLFDIRRAFHNIMIKEEDIPKTAAITPDEHIEFTRVAFGLTNAPAALARALSIAYGHLIPQGLAKYYDDLGGAHDDFIAHIAFLRKFFEATRLHGLKIVKKKCTFAAREIKILGRIITDQGEMPDPNRIAAVSKYRTLNTIHELRSFLGFANTMRKHIKMFASIAAPLNAILRKKPNAVKPPKSSQAIVLDSHQQQAFEMLKTALTTPPILAFFAQGAPTFVETDASQTGLGACLSQTQGGSKRIIEYASRGLSGPETRYHSNELEVIAVHWALMVKFPFYLVGTKFTLITDNFTTAYVLNKAKLNRKFARYAVDLAAFEFEPVHRPGKENQIADHLSRYPVMTCLAIVTSPDSRLKLTQDADAFCQQIIKKLLQEPTSLHLRQIQDSYRLEDGILVHTTVENATQQRKIVIPYTLRSAVLKLCHDDAGHFDSRKTIERVRARYWWSSVRKDVNLYVRGCSTCQQINRRTSAAHGMLGERPLPNTPLEVISVDHLKLPQTEVGNQYLIVQICHATRYVIAVPSTNTGADDVIHSLENNIIYRFGLPLVYISDNGSAFTANKFTATLEKYGIRHALTPPYTPQSNGLVERANQTLISTLTKFASDHPKQWDELLPNALLAINTAQHSSSKISPFFLLHGYTPRLPPDETRLGTFLQEISRLDQVTSLAEIRQISLAQLVNAHAANKARFDAHRQEVFFAPNDIVWYEGPQQTDTKLTPRFKGPYKIVQRLGNVCYRIASLNRPEKTRVVHVQSLRLRTGRPNLDDPGDIPEPDDEDTPNDATETPKPDVQTDEDPMQTIDKVIPAISGRYPARNRHPPKHLENYVCTNDTSQ